MHKAVDEMGTKEHFHGYGPEQGYDFLKEALQAYYGKRNVKLDAVIGHCQKAIADIGIHKFYFAACHHIGIHIDGIDRIRSGADKA